MIVGERIRKVRETRNLTQAQLGKILNVDKTTISHYENDSRTPDLETLRDMASKLKVDINYIIGADYDTCLDKESFHLTEEEIEFILLLRKSKHYRKIMSDPKRYIQLFKKSIPGEEKNNKIIRV